MFADETLRSEHHRGQHQVWRNRHCPLCVYEVQVHEEEYWAAVRSLRTAVARIEDVLLSIGDYGNCLRDLNQIVDNFLREYACHNGYPEPTLRELRRKGNPNA